MILGIISDIHGPLPVAARDALTDCASIIVAGDTESPQTLSELKAIAPVAAIRGNCDRSVDYGPRVTDRLSVRFQGIRFLVVHRREDAIPLPEGTEVVIYGHTHVPEEETIDGVLWLNPGSPSRPRGGNPPTLVRMTIEETEITKVEFVELVDEDETDEYDDGFGEYVVDFSEIG